MITSFKKGDIVMIPDLHKIGKIMDARDLFEDNGTPTVFLKTVQLNPKNGGRNVEIIKRKSDQLDPLPGSLEEIAAAQFYESPAEKVYQFATAQMRKLRSIYASTDQPITVEDQAQRSAGYFEAMRDIMALIENLMVDLKSRSCAATWYVARDNDGSLAIFDDRPRGEELTEGEIWWVSRARERIQIPKDYIPELQNGKCRPCHVTVELIAANADGPENAQ